MLVDPLVVIGPRRTDAMINREAALVLFGDTFESKQPVALKSKGLEVVVSKGGRSAWAFDTLALGGKTLGAAAILENDDDLWQVSTLSIAQMYPGKTLASELAKHAVVPPGATATTKIDDDAEGAVERFKKGLLDQAQWGDDLAARSDALVVGPTTGDLVKGKKAIKKAWKKRVDAKTRAAISGDIVAGVTADGQLAWVSAPLTQVAEGGEPTPLRAFAVFERADDDWKLIMLHEAVAVDQPGAGTEFEKTLPPAAVEEKPPEVEAKADTKPAKKAAKKKAKKKKAKKKKAKVVVEDEDG